MSCFFSNYLFTSFGRQFWICPKSYQRRKWMSPYYEFAIAFSSVFKCKTILKREKCLWKNIFFTYLVLVFPTQEGWQSSISWCIDAQVSDVDEYIYTIYINIHYITYIYYLYILALVNRYRYYSKQHQYLIKEWKVIHAVLFLAPPPPLVSE